MKRKREDHTITVDFKTTEAYLRIIQDGKAFIEFVVAFLVSIGVQLKHRKGCSGGFFLTRHSHYVRALVNDLVIWRVQCTHCKATFTILPHFVLRYRKMPPDIAEKALIATTGGLSLELCSVLFNISAMSLYRLVCAIGRQPLVHFLCRCRLPLPKYILADEKHSKCRADKIYLPTISNGRVVWHLGYATNKSADAFMESYGQFKQCGESVDPDYQVKGILTDGFESTIKSLSTLFPFARIGNCILHAAKKVRGKLKDIPSSLREDLSFQFFDIFKESNERSGLKVFSFAQKLRHFVKKVTKVAGIENGKRIAQWVKEKKDGWFAILEKPELPGTSTLLDQAHNALDRKIFMMKGFHHPNGSQIEFINGIGILYNLMPYQRRAQNAGLCGIQVEGGKIPSKNWFLSLQILSSGGLLWDHSGATT